MILPVHMDIVKYSKYSWFIARMEESLVFTQILDIWIIITQQRADVKLNTLV